MVGISLGLGVILSFFICSFLLEEADILKSSVLSVFLYFCCYVIISGILFGLDIFSIEKAVAIIVIVEGLFVFIMRKRKRIEFKWEVKKYIFPIILTVCVLPFIWNKFGFHGMGQDEGVYQTQAIAFMNHHYENQKDFVEYEIVDEKGKENFEQFVDSQLIGFYRYNYDETLQYLVEEKRLSDVSGFYHGISTFPALLALWGKIFGMSHMADIQTIFYLCGFFLLCFTCENINLKKTVRYGVEVIYVCSPILIWVSKSSLTEMFLACIIIGFLYFMTSNGSSAEIGCAALAVVTFSFYHLTIYTVLPIFILLFWGMFFHSQCNRYIYASVVVFMAFMASMIIYSKIVTIYTYRNFRPIYSITAFISDKTVLPVLIGISILGIILSFALIICRKKIVIFLSKIRGIWKICIRLSIILFAIIQIKIVIGFIADEPDSLLNALQNSAFTGFIMYGGGILLLLTLAYTFFNPIVCLRSVGSMMVMGMFGYCVLFYTSFLRKDIPYHYYFGRYLAPFICIVVLMIGIVVNEYNKIRTEALVWLMVFGYAVICLPYDLVLAKNNDDTRMSWDVMEDIAEIIPDNATVYMDFDIGRLLYLPMRELANVNIFPVRSEGQQEKLNSINNGESDIYYIAEMNQYLPLCDVVYANWYETSENTNKSNGKIIPLPLKMEKENRGIAVYKVLKERYQYRFSDKDFMIGGYYSLESDFRWSSPIKNVMKCVLHKDDYTIRVEQGSIVPLNELGREEYEVQLEINGQYVNSCKITKEELDSELVFEVPKEMVKEGSNEISFICDPWSPQDYGISDSRVLGIAIRQVLFQPGL